MTALRESGHPRVSFSSILALLCFMPQACVVIKGEPSPEPLGVDGDGTVDTGGGFVGPTAVDPQQEIYDHCENECVEYVYSFPAFETQGKTSADIEFYGWSFFCKTYDESPSNFIDTWYVSNIIGSYVDGISQSDVEAATNRAWVDLISNRTTAHITIVPIFSNAPGPNDTVVQYAAGATTGVDAGALAYADVVATDGADSIWTTIWVQEKWLNRYTGLEIDSPISLDGSAPDPAVLHHPGTFSLKDLMLHETMHVLGVGHLLGSNIGLMERTISAGASSRPLSQLEGEALDFLYTDWLNNPVPQTTTCP